MPNLDLFAPATVTLDDVELWLRTVPRLCDLNRADQVLYYIDNYDVVNKIIKAKLDNSFYSLNDKLPDDKQNLSNMLQPLIKPRYHPLPFVPYASHIKRNRAQQATTLQNI